MHFDLEQILWALILASHLILLIVLLGRDRAHRFPFFTASIALSAASLIANHLLHGKLTTIAFYWQSYSMLGILALVGIGVLIELARQVFSSGQAGKVLKPRGWLGGTLVILALSTAALWAWGPWPTWAELNAQPAQLPLLLDVLAAMKLQLLVSLLTVQVGLLLGIFGSRFGARWSSHPQQIALGLSTNALAFLAVQGITDAIKHSIHLTTREQYEHVLKLFSNLENARTVLWLLVLVGWIICLSRDEPGASGAATLAALVPAPVLADDDAAEPEPFPGSGDSI